MHRPFAMLVVGAVAAACLTIGVGTYWYKRPARLTVAISRADAEDFALVTAAANLLAARHGAARLQIQPVENPAAAAAAVDGGKADLAVVRTDLVIPAKAQTVVILHRDAALLVAPDGSPLKDVASLAGHTVGIVRRGTGNEGLLATLLAQADLPADAVKVVGLKPDEIEAALRSHAVDVVMAVDVLSNNGLRDIVRAVAAAGPSPDAAPAAVEPAAAKPAAEDEAEEESPADHAPAKGPVFIPIAEAEAIALRSPAYEKTEVVRGIFGGTPPRPPKNYDTLSITHRLVANEAVSQDLISSLTEFFLTEKWQMAAMTPLAQRIEAPSTDKGATLPVHAGTAAYIDDEEETFFDKYSDFIYIGAMLMGVLASGVTAVLGRLNSRRTASLETSVGRLIEMLAGVRGATAPAALDAIQAEADTLLAGALGAAGTGGDDGRLTVFTLALDQVRAAVRDRRAVLAARGPEVAPVPVRAAE